MELSEENRQILAHIGKILEKRFAELAAGRAIVPDVTVEVTIDTGPIAVAIADSIAKFRESLAQAVEQVVERLGEQAPAQVEVVVEPKIELHRAPRTIRITHSDGSTSTVSEAG